MSATSGWRLAKSNHERPFRGNSRTVVALTTPLILGFGGKFVVSRVAEAYDARAKGRNRKFQMRPVFL